MRYLILGVLLQGGCNALLGVGLTVSESLRFSAVAFALAAFGAIVAQKATGTDKPGKAVPPSDAIALNVATAVTFLSFYTALVWIPASVVAGVESGIAPAVALALWGRRSTVYQWLIVVALLVASVAFGLIQYDIAATTPIDFLFGIGLAMMAGLGMTTISALTRKLGSRGVRSVDVLAVRYHLTYLLATAAVWVVPEATSAEHLSWSEIVVFAVLGIIAPLALYQVGMSRTPPVIAMGLITLVPVTSFVVERIAGHPITLAASLLVVIITVLALVASRFQPRQRTPTLDAAEVSSS
ncbi:hypothetical protein [Actinopolyspora mortivallis]|uniref:EamA family transporter n=1 Tax=Actinopolyspora mortivallis TaxID=33906 RepID=A0A2T0GZK9_ACTMO|nr:hypothetical protein [Actinopolyspora mortivallis]PRW64556.1 hypothetical protein CEP50_04165 [Actinopolyspora mortivallis]